MFVMVVATCPRCCASVALLDGRPQITAAGHVELWHAACWAARDIPFVAATAAAIELPPRPTVSRRAVRTLLGGFAASVAVSIGMAHYVWVESPAPLPATGLNLELAPPVEIATRARGISHERKPGREAHVETKIEAKYPIPEVGVRQGIPPEVPLMLAMADLKIADLGTLPGEDHRRLDELYPTLTTWVHPVSNSPELYPANPGRHFGALRVGIMRAECGEGHCGVDLDGPRGRPVIAVAGGTVVRVEHSELGLDGRSGRYVRIEHDDGTLTAYMHLDEIADHINPGTKVVAGQYLGTLGATATYECPAHLHFSLEIPNHPGLHGDNTDTHYVDPAPFLVRATIDRGPQPEHVAVIKPAS